MYKKKELQLSYFSICEGKKLDDKIVTYFALKTGSTVVHRKYNLLYISNKCAHTPYPIVTIEHRGHFSTTLDK